MNGNGTPTRQRIGRRRFLGVTGGLAAAGLLTACDAGVYDDPSFGKNARAAATGTAEAASPTPMASSDHSAPLPTAGDRPKPSGTLATVSDAALAPVDPNPAKTLVIEAKDNPIEVAAGINFNAWTFDGVVPGKVVHLRLGDTVDFSLRNKSTQGHSIDFHAAQTPW